jgi:hypothetical protein
MLNVTPALVCEAMTEADSSFRALIECECLWVGDCITADRADAGWWDTTSGDHEETSAYAKAVSYLDRRGLLIRKEGEPHLVRFKPQPERTP